MTKFSIRRFDSTSANILVNAGFPVPLARAFAARGVKDSRQLNYDFTELLSPESLKNCREAGEMLAEAIKAKKKIVIIGDYDCDGATAVALGTLGLTLLGSTRVDFLIPDRDKDGYGLSESLVDKAAEKQADIIVTVDNGISSYDAVAYAKSKGLTVLITDHHLAPEKIPEADCIVNPNQPGDEFESKALAGVGVMYYVLISTRAVLREAGFYDGRKVPNLLNLIDLVALGTIADVVPLDKNNRILVTKGLERIRQGRMQPGLTALLNIAGRNCNTLTAQDLAFSIAPRLNAAGRIANITSGVNCLISANIDSANKIAEELDRLNKERKQRQDEMQKEALSQMSDIEISESSAICLYNPSWHAGIVGLVASKVKERCYRPTIAFAPSVEDGTAGQIKGSGRSITGVHLRDVLAAVDRKHPNLIIKFGGHALAAGLTILEKDFDVFREAFEEAVLENAPSEVFEKTVLTDGELETRDFNMRLAGALSNYVWGQSFPEPLFANHFKVVKQTLLKEKHLRLSLEYDGVTLSAIWFNHKKPLPHYAYLSYRLNVNEWQGRRSLQLIIDGMEEPEDDWA